MQQKLENLKNNIILIFKKIDNLIPNNIKKHIPNIITSMRIILTFCFINSFLKGNMNSSLLFFASASISDAIDGNLARKWKVQSKFGKYLDPVADKFLVGSALLLYGLKYNALYMLLTGEIAISAINTLSMARIKKVDVNKVGKIKTIALMTTTSLTILLASLNNDKIIDSIIQYLVALNIPFQSATLVEYLEQLKYNNTKNNVKKINEIKDSPKKYNYSKDIENKIEYLKNEKELLKNISNNKNIKNKCLFKKN